MANSFCVLGFQIKISFDFDLYPLVLVIFPFNDGESMFKNPILVLVKSINPLTTDGLVAKRTKLVHFAWFNPLGRMAKQWSRAPVLVDGFRVF